MRERHKLGRPNMDQTRDARSPSITTSSVRVQEPWHQYSGRFDIHSGIEISHTMSRFFVQNVRLCLHISINDISSLDSSSFWFSYDSSDVPLLGWSYAMIGSSNLFPVGSRRLLTDSIFERIRRSRGPGFIGSWYGCPIVFENMPRGHQSDGSN